MKTALIAIALMAASAQAQQPDACSVYITHLQDVSDKHPSVAPDTPAFEPTWNEWMTVRDTIFQLSNDAPNDPAQCAALDKQFTALDIPAKLHLVPVHTPTLEEQSERDMQLLQQAIGDVK